MKQSVITEGALAALIPAFYAKVQQDLLIGPIFNRAIDDWEAHFTQLQAFWSSVMLGTGRYHGRPLPAHIKHGDAISPAAFERWLQLWRESTNELLTPRAAEAMQEKAARIAESLTMGIAVHRHGIEGAKAGFNPVP